mmetsp:Transcript_6362/g.18296  ORF Transcript_6362/g.18296 Transcript_6362/m.18296 type:complete len:108 (-) Transcript_6362:834-1157(-)
MSQQQGAALLRAGFRRVLRVHRDKLPPPMKVMGDAYARQEFKAWGQATVNQQQWAEFEGQWRRYCDALLGVADSPAATSGDIQDDILSSMSEEQKAQLAKLREALTT